MAQKLRDNAGKPEEQGVPDRLRQAIDKAGGQSTASRVSGVPMSTLSEYLKGTEARFGRMAKLAHACNVSLDWLATGRGSMHLGEVDGAASITIPGFPDELVNVKAHFWALLSLLRVCREYHDGVALSPTLLEVFQWIGPHYGKSMELPDRQIEFRSPEES